MICRPIPLELAAQREYPPKPFNVWCRAEMINRREQIEPSIEMIGRAPRGMKIHPAFLQDPQRFRALDRIEIANHKHRHSRGGRGDPIRHERGRKLAVRGAPIFSVQVINPKNAAERSSNSAQDAKAGHDPLKVRE